MPHPGTEVLVQWMGMEGKRDRGREGCCFAFAQPAEGRLLESLPSIPLTLQEQSDAAGGTSGLHSQKPGKEGEGEEGKGESESSGGPLGIAAPFCGLADVSLGGGFPYSLALLHA